MEALNFCFPNLTRTISITGNDCALSCAHCNKYYLRFMETPEEVMSQGPRNYKSALVSGGMNESGWVPVEQFTDFYTLLKQWNWRLNFHVGLFPEELMKTVKNMADRISFDYVVDRVTINEVYGISARGEDFQRTYRALKKNFKVVPHITLGLYGGRISGEWDALDSLKDFNPDEIIFLIFRPTRNTKYHGKTPPSFKEVESIFKYARDLFPEAVFSLGCMRPRGEYGFQLEKCALHFGFKKFVLPSKLFRDQVSKRGFRIIDSWECCIL